MYMYSIESIDTAGRFSAMVYNQNTVCENGDFQPLYAIISRKRQVKRSRLLTNRQWEIAYRWLL